MENSESSPIRKRRELPPTPVNRNKPFHPVPLRTSFSNDNPQYRAPPYQFQQLYNNQIQKSQTEYTQVPISPVKSHVNSPYHMHPAFNLDSSFSTKQQNTLLRQSVNYIAPPNFNTSPTIPSKPQSLIDEQLQMKTYQFDHGHGYNYSQDYTHSRGNSYGSMNSYKLHPTTPNIPQKPQELKEDMSNVKQEYSHLDSYPALAWVNNQHQNHIASDHYHNYEHPVCMPMPQIPHNIIEGMQNIGIKNGNDVYEKDDFVKNADLNSNLSEPKASSYFDYGNAIPEIYAENYDNSPLNSPDSQRRRSLTHITRIGLDSNLVTNEKIEIPGLLSEIVEIFKRTSQEIMTGSQILDYIEKAANIPRGYRNLSMAVCSALQPYRLFIHTVDEDLPVLDGLEEIYVVDIGRLQRTSFSPKGVLTNLTRCYFPTCSLLEPCKRTTCPTRKIYLDGASGELRVVNLTNNISENSGSQLLHRKSYSHADIVSFNDSDTVAPSIYTLNSLQIPDNIELWAQAVPDEIVSSVTADEKKRQELIFETIKTERDFVKDMESIDNIFVRPLKVSSVYEKARVDAVLSTLFYNYKDIITLNQTLFQSLKKRQSEDYIVYSIGDIFLEWAAQLDCYAIYGGHLAYTQDFIKNEIEYNPKFAQFLKECEKHPEARRLSIQSFVGRATTRLGRYPLLLEGILKKTEEGNPDRNLIPKALELIRESLNLVNKLAGEADQKLKINYINSHLYFKPEDDITDLKLDSPVRKLIKEGTLKRGSLHGSQNIAVFLFDNALVIAKEKKKVVTEYRSVCPAMLLHSLQLSAEVSMRSYYQKLAESTKAKAQGEASYTQLTPGENELMFSLTLYGKKVTTQYLIASSSKEKTEWVKAIQEAIASCPQVSNKVLNVNNIFQSHLTQSRLLCSCDCQVNREQVFIFGCDDGVHILSQAGALRRIIKSPHRVVQIEAVEEHHMLIVLFSDKLLMAYHLDVLVDTSGRLATMSTKLSENVSFFKVGQCGERKLLISTKHNSLKSYFKTMEFVNFNTESKLSHKNKLLWQSKYKTGLRFLKKFYVATVANNISFLKTRLAIACGPGFEIVNLDALDCNYSVPEFLDPVINENSNLNYRFNDVMPLAMVRTNPGEFLLCYKEFGLYINNSGKTSRGLESFVEWQGTPTNFKLIYPHLLCFDSHLIEVRHINNGELIQVLLFNNVQLSNPSSSSIQETQCIADNRGGSGQRFFQLIIQPETIPPSPACTTNSY